MVGVSAGQQSRVHCVKLAAQKLSIWRMRLYPTVMARPNREEVNHQKPVNASVRYIEDGIIFDGKAMSVTSLGQRGWAADCPEVPLDGNTSLRLPRGLRVCEDPRHRHRRVSMQVVLEG